MSAKRNRLVDLKSAWGHGTPEERGDFITWLQKQHPHLLEAFEELKGFKRVVTGGWPDESEMREKLSRLDEARKHKWAPVMVPPNPVPFYFKCTECDASDVTGDGALVWRERQQSGVRPGDKVAIGEDEKVVAMFGSQDVETRPEWRGPEDEEFWNERRELRQPRKMTAWWSEATGEVQIYHDRGTHESLGQAVDVEAAKILCKRWEASRLGIRLRLAQTPPPTNPTLEDPSI